MPDQHRPRYAPVELTDIEKARLRASRSAFSSLRDAFLGQDGDGALAASRQFRQIELDRDRVRDALNLPEDAGEHTEGLTRIMLRIPDGWGRWISLSRGWYPIITRLDEALAGIDPDYDVHQVKQKFGYLMYYYSPAAQDTETRQRMEALVAAAQAEAESTCEECGASGSDVTLRENDEEHEYRWIMTLCDDCEAANPDHKP